MIITGEKFSEIPEENIVTIGGIPCVVISSNSTTITCDAGKCSDILKLKMQTTILFPVHLQKSKKHS